MASDVFMKDEFSLSAEERRELRAILRARKEDALVARRANALLLLDESVSVTDIARFLYLDVDTVRGWRRAYEASGLSILSLADYPSRTGYLSESQEADLINHVMSHPMRCTGELRAYILDVYGVRFSHSGAIKLMKRLGFVYKRPKLLPLKATPEAQAEFISSYEHLCNTLSADESIVFVDAVHPEHQSRPAYGWFHKGTQPVLPANSGRQRMNIHGAVNLETGDVQLIEALTINAESTRALLEKIERAHPAQTCIHVFLDNARYHHAKGLKPWLSDPTRRVKLHFLPAYAPHLNPIERLWGVMHRYVTHNRHYATFADFKAAILHFFRKTLPDKWHNIRDNVSDNFRIIHNTKNQHIQC